MSDLVKYSAQVDRADGVVVRVEILTPADRPDHGELAELAQMTASRGSSAIDSNDAARAGMQARHDLELQRDAYADIAEALEAAGRHKAADMVRERRSALWGEEVLPF